MSSNYFTALFVTLAATAVVLYFTVTTQKQGVFPHWIPAKLAILDQLNSEISGNKIIIVSGSNGQFGIDSDQLSRLTELEVLNAATHAGLDMTFYVSLVERYVATGDLVVLPLEFAHYKRDKLTREHTRHMSLWGATILDPLSQFEFFRAVDAPSLIEQRLTYLSTNYLKPTTLIDFVSGQSLSEQAAQRRIAFYTWENLNKNGEFIYNYGPRERALELHFNYGLPVRQISDRFIRKFQILERSARNIGANVMLTYPTTMRNFKFDLYETESQDLIKDLEKKMSNFGIRLHCNAAAFHLDPSYFLNTESHLNARGIDIRTRNLASCINAHRGRAPKSKLDIADTYLKTTRQQLETPGLEISKFAPLDKRRLLDIYMVKQALRRYKAKYGQYPTKKRVTHENAGEDIAMNFSIPGLVPEFLSQSMTESLDHLADKHQYQYVSDGLDYKFIVYIREKKVFMAELLADPVRPGIAAGIWTEGARSW